MTSLSTFTHFASEALLAEAMRLAANERRATGQLIAALAEVDARKLYLGEGCSSLFVYCTRVLHLSEYAAYSRIEAARAARRFPAVLELLIDGALTLTSVTLLAAHLTEDNSHAVLAAARHKSKREVEAQVAALRPLPPVAPIIRKVTGNRPVVPRATGAADMFEVEPVPPAPPARPAKPPSVKALAPEHYRIGFTISRETHEKLRRAQDLVRHSIPDGDPARIFDRALTLLLADVERKKLGAAKRPRAQPRPSTSSTRHIPASVRREVWQRDGGRCAFVGTNGRCDERGFLEFHHRQPFASGGPSTVENLELRCRLHNAYEAELLFGPLIAREDRAVFVAAGTRSGPG